MNLLLLGKLQDFHRIEVLRKAGHVVQLTENRDEALRKVQRGEFDCVVLSYSLPNDMIKELTELLGQHCPECPTIVISENGKIDWELGPNRTVHPREGSQALLAALADMEQAHAGGGSCPLAAASAKRRRPAEALRGFVTRIRPPH